MSGEYHQAKDVVQVFVEERRVKADSLKTAPMPVGLVPAPGKVRSRGVPGQVAAAPRKPDQIDWKDLLDPSAPQPSFLAPFVFSSIISGFGERGEQSAALTAPLTTFSLLPGSGLADLDLDPSRRRIVG
jgi:hypothetical protein